MKIHYSLLFCIGMEYVFQKLIFYQNSLIWSSVKCLVFIVSLTQNTMLPWVLAMYLQILVCLQPWCVILVLRNSDVRCVALNCSFSFPSVTFRFDTKDYHLALPYYRMAGLSMTEVLERLVSEGDEIQTYERGFIFYLTHSLNEDINEELSKVETSIFLLTCWFNYNLRTASNIK